MTEVASAVHLRRARDEDFLGWFMAFEDVAREGQFIAASAPLDRTVRRRQFDRYLHDPHRKMIVAVQQSVCGVAMLIVEDQGVGDIGLFITKGARRQGIGQRLMHRLMSEAPEGIESFRADVFASNVSSIRFFESMGFVVSKSIAAQTNGRNVTRLTRPGPGRR